MVNVTHRPLDHETIVDGRDRRDVRRRLSIRGHAFTDADRPEPVRLAVPRRTYGPVHFEHVAETVRRVLENRESVRGLQLASDPPIPELRHVTAELEPVPTAAASTAQTE